MRPDYFEGILQLRNPTKKLVEFVYEELDKNKVWVAKGGQVRGGFDFYVSSNDFLRRLSFTLKKKFGGVLKMTYTLHTQKKGKDLYRTTLMFKISPFKENDMIEFKGDIYKVMRLNVKVELKNMQTGKTKLVKFEDIEKSFKKISKKSPTSEE
jgi:nonsense-mediated mRNA decay protein 3